MIFLKKKIVQMKILIKSMGDVTQRIESSKNFFLKKYYSSGILIFFIRSGGGFFLPQGED